jgi:hypothetical protein
VQFVPPLTSLRGWACHDMIVVFNFFGTAEAFFRKTLVIAVCDFPSWGNHENVFGESNLLVLKCIP